MDKSHLSKYPEIEIDKIPNSTNSNMTFPITIEQYYDLMHHTHKASDIIIEGQGTDQIDNIIIDNLNTNIQELKETTEKQNEIIVKQTKSIETLTKQVKDLQDTIDSMSQDMITTPDGDDIITG